MTADDIKKLHADLTRLTTVTQKTSVGGSKESHLIEALRTSVDMTDVQRVINGLEHAYGILAIRGKLQGE